MQVAVQGRQGTDRAVLAQWHVKKLPSAPKAESVETKRAVLSSVERLPPVILYEVTLEQHHARARLDRGCE
jgi:hypothetical protein